MIEPLAVALHGVKQTTAAEGQVGVVGGAGPIGLLVAAVLKAKGLKTIISEVSQIRREKAQSSGVADVVVDPTSEDLKAIVSEQTSDAMADVAFDAAGAAPVVGQLLDVLGHRSPAGHRHPWQTGRGRSHRQTDDAGSDPRCQRRLCR
ncbi:zinc-binding dehydrogenase [Brevibacterium sp. 1718]|uniref:zinc-binding dehydrogenase n=1 Tax=Brevibacterium sp. 1718 TaxID=3413510 RepID=UPI003DA9548A